MVFDYLEEIDIPDIEKAAVAYLSEKGYAPSHISLKKTCLDQIIKNHYCEKTIPIFIGSPIAIQTSLGRLSVIVMRRESKALTDLSFILSS